ncbi:unnamed protein product [Urochloa humidicola]
MEEAPHPPSSSRPAVTYTAGAATISWPQLLAPFDLMARAATLSSHPLTTLRRLARLDWYAYSHLALSLSSLPLRPFLAGRRCRPGPRARTPRLPPAGSLSAHSLTEKEKR